MKIKSLSSIKKLSGKRVLVRVDFNVPLKNGKIKEIYKIEKSLPTINYLLRKKAKVILVSHLGRPKGADKSLSLRPIGKKLGQLLRRNISFISINEKFSENSELKKLVSSIGKLAPGSVALIENIRFIKGEDDNDKQTAKALASLADIFVLDGFAVAHRNAASVSGVARYLPSFAGLLMESEMQGLNRVLIKPAKPYVVILGGAKMETKVPLIKKLLPICDYVLIGGGIVNSCLWAKDFKIGRSIVDKEFKKEALSYWNNKKIIFPIDIMVGGADGKNAKAVNLSSKFKIFDSKIGIYDIGPKSVELFKKYIVRANTIVWNGAMGMFEVKQYRKGSYAIARLLAKQSRGKPFCITGGGETVEIVKALKLDKKIDLVSTGGGAMLEYLSGKTLPGVRAVASK